MSTALVISWLLTLGSMASPVAADQQTDDTIGESPDDDAGHDLSRLFLRDSEVLLNPKEVQVSLGLNYRSDENQRSFRRNRSRSLSMPLSISYGVTRRLEVNASIPFVYNESEIVSVDNANKTSKSGLGDMSLGFSYRMKPESLSSPSITASLNVIVPTGEEVDPRALNDLAAGSGLWGVSTHLSFAKSIDPAVVFFSLGYQYTFDDDQFGNNIQPGSVFNYGFGAGLSVNSSVALSARISGGYQRATKVNRQVEHGTSSEPISLIGSMSYRINQSDRLETTVSIGASEDADDVGMGFSYIRSL